MEPAGRKWGKESITPPILRWGNEEWSDLGRSLGEFLGIGYQSERNKIVGVGRIFRGMTLYPDLWWRVTLTFSTSPIMVPWFVRVPYLEASWMFWLHLFVETVINSDCRKCYEIHSSSLLPILSLFFSKLTVLTFLQLHINCFSS